MTSQRLGNMAKRSSRAATETFQWRLLVQSLQQLPFETMLNQVIQDFTHGRRSRVQRWIVILAGAAGLFYWNGRLVLALGAGLSVMVLVYLMHDWQLDVNFAQLRKYLQGWNQPFALSAGAGAIATLTTYTAAAVWAESDSAWIATATILQGMGTLTVLLWLINQAVNRQASRDRVQHHQLIQDLAHSDPLKRLIAIRQLTDTISVLDEQPQTLRGPGKTPTRQEIADYFRLMLSREEDSVIRDALWDGLQTLDIVQSLQQATAPLVTLSPRPPLKLTAKPQPVTARLLR